MLFRTKPPRFANPPPCPSPQRAKPGVDATADGALEARAITENRVKLTRRMANLIWVTGRTFGMAMPAPDLHSLGLTRPQFSRVSPTFPPHHPPQNILR